MSRRKTKPTGHPYSVRPRAAVLGALLFSLLAMGCGEPDGTLVVYLSSSSELAEDPLDPSVVRWLRIRVEGPDMGVVNVEGAFERGGSTRVPPVPAGEERRIIVEGLTGQDGLLVSRGESLPMAFSPGRNEVELYVGLVERFSSAAGDGLLPLRHGAAISRTGDDKVIFVGGESESGGDERFLGLVDRFEPGFGRLGPSLSCEDDTGCEIARRVDPVAVPIEGGVFFAGGRTDGGLARDSAVCAGEVCSRVEGPELARVNGVAAALPGGGGFLLGGDDEEGAVTRVDYVSGSGEGRRGVFSLPVEGEGLAAAIDGEGGLLVAGFADGVVRSFGGDIFTGGSSIRVNEISSARDRRDSALVTLGDGRVLLIGGRDEDGALTPAIELFDPGRSIVCTVAALIRPRWGHSADRLRDGRILVSGGIASLGQTIPDVEIIDPRYLPENASCERLEGRLEVRSAARLSAPRSGHATIGLPNGMLLVAGGVDAVGEPVPRLEIYVPSS